MRKTFYLITLTFITFVSFGQTNVQKIIPSKEVKIEYTNGKEVFHICVVNPEINFDEKKEYFWYTEFSKIKSTKGGTGGSLLHGSYKFYDEKGNLKTESNYYLGLRDGNTKVWDSIGEIVESYKFNRGKAIYSKFKDEEHDDIIEWNGPVLEAGSIKKVYTSYGRLFQIEEQLENLKTRVTKFYSNNKIEKKYTTTLGTLWHDEYFEYYENGKIKLYGKFEDNFRIGDWKWYKEDGSIDAIEKYRINKEFYSNGKMKIEGGEYFNQKNNEWIRNGFWFWFEENGKDLISSKDYEFGVEKD